MESVRLGGIPQDIKNLASGVDCGRSLKKNKIWVEIRKNGWLKTSKNNSEEKVENLRESVEILKKRV